MDDNASLSHARHTCGADDDDPPRLVSLFPILFPARVTSAEHYWVTSRERRGCKVKCPYCGSEHVTFLAKNGVWKCYSGYPRPKFSLKTGTVFEDSPIPLEKWFPALWLVVNCKNGISSCELARDLGVTQKSAWFMAHRIRYALKSGGFNLLSGECEADETFIGGKARNMHIDVKKRRITGSGPADKTAVMGILQRGDKKKGINSVVRTSAIADRKKKTIQAEVKANVHKLVLHCTVMRSNLTMALNPSTRTTL